MIRANIPRLILYIPAWIRALPNFPDGSDRFIRIRKSIIMWDVVGE